MTAEAVPMAARMIITRRTQEGKDTNQLATASRKRVNEGIGAANDGKACATVRWFTSWLTSQYLSIVFMGSPRRLYFLIDTLLNTGTPSQPLGYSTPSTGGKIKRAETERCAKRCDRLRCPTRMDASFRRIVTRDLTARESVAAEGECARIDNSRQSFEAGDPFANSFDFPISEFPGYVANSIPPKTGSKH